MGVLLLIIQALDVRNLGANNGEGSGGESSVSLEERVVKIVAFWIVILCFSFYILCF